jgi:hypothetical protein
MIEKKKECDMELTIQDGKNQVKLNLKEWISKDSLLQYIRDLETSNQMYGKDTQTLFDDLVEEIEK